MGGKQKSRVTHLTDTVTEQTSATTVNVTEEIITDPQEQAALMGRKWRTIFTNNEAENNNENINKVNAWFDTVNPTLKQSEVINYDLLIEDHPLMRPFSLEEIK